MNNKKVLRNLIGLLLIICLAMLPSIVNAASLNPPLYFGITELRESGMGYSIGDPGVNGTTGPAAKIWNIVQYSGANTNDPTEANVYCVKAGVGFTEGDGIKGTQEYDVQFDMYTEREAIAAQNEVLNGLVNGGHYNELLALADLIYIPGESTEAEKVQLIEAAGIYQEQYPSEEYYITDDEIEAVQQAAMWYFTNYGEEEGKYDKYNNTSWLWYTTDGSEYANLTSYNPTGVDVNSGAGKARQEQAELLYKYLIDEAKENASQYADSNVRHRNKLTLYASTENGMAQPLMHVERIPDFDLSLRKYITKVNGEEVANSRVPVIDESTLESGTTATYNHRKDPIMVEEGDTVTYNITIYNEGELAGRATEIIDQLPTGLRYSKINTQGFTATYDEATNRVTITRDENNTENLAAYTKGSLDSETIEIECIVGASENGKILTNVAWISEEIDENGNVITNEVGEDRDSEPATAPNVNKDNMENYKGNTANEDDLTNSNYFYKGEQDDDDFEKLQVRKLTGEYEVQLEKVDENGNLITTSGAEFGWTLPGQSEQTGTTTGGRLYLGTVGITDISSIDTITVREITAPNGYNKLIENLTIQVTKGEANESYVATGATITAGEVQGAKVELNGNVITITVPNVLKEGNYQVQLEKVDENGNLITSSGAEFGWTLPGQSEQTGTTTEGRLQLGTVEITDISSVDTITIREITAPNGYKKLIESLTIQVTKGEVNGSYAATGATITAGEVQGAKVELNGNVITITVPNEKQDFDLALRKFISEVDGTTYNREPNVDLSGLENGTTAIYNHTKEPVLVKRNSVIIYTIRVYNEGEIDGYAERITDYLPEGLEYLPEHEINKEYEWEVSEDGREVTTDYLSSAKETTERENIIQAYDGERLDYKEVQIACRVKEEAETNVKLTNLAEITEDSDEDRDSTPDNVEIPNDEELPGYKDEEIEQEYVPGQEDDDDFEKVIIQEFDLALRKFITKVDDEEVTNRIPEVSYNREENEITYNHTKEPVEVVTGNVVEYTIRVYNEGDIAGYAEEVADDIPDGLRYLPENATNIEYRWVMYDAEGNETENVEEAVEIRTDYLSKEQEETEGENLLQAFNPEEEIGEGNPDYRDIKVAFEVIEPNSSDRIIINSAQITEDSDENGNPVEDKDSIPDEWNEGEDDQDKEYIKLTYFDLALRKWVTEAIVIEDGKETVTQTGHTAEMDPEPVVKVELYRKDINDVIVKFRYKIRVTNEGDIAGYAKEITDYVPEGLRFVAEDNPGWTDEGNNVISTRLLENTLLQPGESAEVEVVLTWINSEDNMGQMTNTAEISEDYNDKGVPDRDSTPDNQVPGEDDIDDAPVLLSIETGQQRIYFVLGLTTLGTLAGGLVLIKKFVI